MIRIAVGYKDLMNLYGDYANVAALTRYLRENGFLVETDHFSSASYVNLESIDLLYIGAGTERRMLIALEDFRRYFNELRRFVDRGGFILATGSALALFGNTIVDYNGVLRSAAGLLDTDVTLIKKRSYSDLILKAAFCEQPIVGSINSSSVIITRGQPMFTVEKESLRKNRVTEGCCNRTVFATELSGPLFIRNPSLLHYFAERVSDKKLPESAEAWINSAREGHKRVLENLRRELRGNIWQR